jgi:hypothetical protein
MNEGDVFNTEALQGVDPARQPARLLQPLDPRAPTSTERPRRRQARRDVKVAEQIAIISARGGFSGLEGAFVQRVLRDHRTSSAGETSQAYAQTGDRSQN